MCAGACICRVRLDFVLPSSNYCKNYIILYIKLIRLVLCGSSARTNVGLWLRGGGAHSVRVRACVCTIENGPVCEKTTCTMSAAGASAAQAVLASACSSSRRRRPFAGRASRWSECCGTGAPATTARDHNALSARAARAARAHSRSPSPAARLCGRRRHHCARPCQHRPAGVARATCCPAARARAALASEPACPLAKPGCCTWHAGRRAPPPRPRTPLPGPAWRSCAKWRRARAWSVCAAAAGRPPTRHTSGARLAAAASQWPQAQQSPGAHLISAAPLARPVRRHCSQRRERARAHTPHSDHIKAPARPAS